MKYQVIRTQSVVYLDEVGEPRQGFRVDVLLSEWNEAHFIYVPELDPELIDRKVKRLVDLRKKLDELGG